MTRKDYVMLAEALMRAYPFEHDDVQYVAIRAHKDCVGEIADALARDNPRFDRERFLRAAGVLS